MLKEIFHTYLWVGAMAAAGCIVGVVATRLIDALQKVLEASWAAQNSGQALGVATVSAATPEVRYLVAIPHNIEASSAKVAAASAEALPAGARWPVALLMTVVFALCGWRYDPGWHLALAAVFCCVLVVLVFIDARTYLLPDVLTLPLLWLGLLVSTQGLWVTSGEAIWGAAWGYGVLWLVYRAFRLVTGKEGMGYGDFKLLAAVGAWVGVNAVAMVMLMAAVVVGIVVTVAMSLLGCAQPGQALPFGPALALAGAAALLWPAWMVSPWG